ncbi:hypothetical protein KJ865_02650, partial [Myxococcota bacterium]|nr:hypothetical protein [Myxococcota bacterium]
MRIFQLVLFIALICFSTVAGAQELESQSFKLNPWVFMDELPTSFSGATAVKRSYVVALMLNYQRAPLTLWRTDPWKVESHIIGHQVTGDLLVGYGVLEWFDVGLAIPLVLYQSGDGLPDADKPS